MTNENNIIGKMAKIKKDNDNENYSKYRGMTLIVTHASREGRGYDSGMYPQLLCDFKCIDGREFPFSLYEYEFFIF